MRPWHYQSCAKHLYESYIYRYALQFKQTDNKPSLHASPKPLLESWTHRTDRRSSITDAIKMNKIKL